MIIDITKIRPVILLIFSSECIMSDTIGLKELEAYLKDLEAQKESIDNTPLTKTKAKALAKEQVQAPVKEVVQAPIKEEAVKEEPVKEKKPRKPKTQGQIDAFNKMIEKKREKEKSVKLEKELQNTKLLIAKKLAEKTKKKAVVEESESDSSEEEIIVKRKPKAVKAKKQRVIELTDSESEEIEKPITKQKDFGKSRQNKNSVVTMPDTQIKSTKTDYKNFFV